MRWWRALLCCLLVCAVTHAAALHADEQGLRDWVSRYVGDVHAATVLPPLRAPHQQQQAHGVDDVLSLPHLVVASRDGAVAALPEILLQQQTQQPPTTPSSLPDGSSSHKHSSHTPHSTAAVLSGTSAMTWREVHVEAPQCVTATAQGVVVAVSAQGTVTVMNAETGFIDVTFALDMPFATTSNNNSNSSDDEDDEAAAGATQRVLPAADAVACAAHAGSTHVSVVLVSQHVAYVYDVDVDASVERVAATHTVPLTPSASAATPVAAVRDVRLSSRGHMWVNWHNATATLYDVARGAWLRHVRGYCADVDAHNTAVVLTPSHIHVYATKGDNNDNDDNNDDGTRVACDECSAVLLRRVHSHDDDDDDKKDGDESSDAAAAHHARGGGVVYARAHASNNNNSSSNDTTVTVTFASGRVVHVPTYAAVGRVHVLLAYTHDDGDDNNDNEDDHNADAAARRAPRHGDEVALLRTAAHDLVLVSASRGVLWWRAEGLVHAPATLLLADMAAAVATTPATTTTTTAADEADAIDHLHFHKVAYVASRHGVLYRVPLAHKGRRVDALVDFTAPALAQLQQQQQQQQQTYVNVTRDALVVRDMTYLDAATASAAASAAAAAVGAQQQHDDGKHRDRAARARASVPLLRIRATAPGDVTLLIDVDVRARRVRHVTPLRDALVVSPTLLLQRQASPQAPAATSSSNSSNSSARDDDDATTTTTLQLLTPAPSTETLTYVVNTSSGRLTGYRIRPASSSSSSSPVTLLWAMQLPQPLVAYATGQQAAGRTDVVNQLHIYPNRTGDEPVDEVLHRYPLHHVIATAYYEHSDDELPTLVVVVVDAVTGSVLATTRHRNVEGAVHMVVVEHAVVYYFLDAQRMRYCFGVLELFEQRTQRVTRSDGATLPQIVASFFVRRTRTFSARASRPPLVVATVLGAYGGPLADLSVTTSRGAIARKSLVLTYATGRVAMLELRQLLAGGQMPLPPYKDRTLTHVIVPSVMLATHRYRLAQPYRIATAPTALESSSHVLVTGMDVFYVRTSSSGKPFDVLNSDFNKPLLITLFSVFAALSLLARFLVQRKGIHVLWQ